MKIEVSGIQYSGFTEASTTQYLDSLSSKFNFKATAKDGIPLPFSGGESCVVLVDDEQVLNGFIEIVESSGSESEHSINIAGRDKTCDLVDSYIGSINDIKPPISLSSIISQVISHLGTSISVIDNLRPKLFTKTKDLVAPEPGQRVWDFIQSLARKRQALLTSDSDGNIVITQASGSFAGATLQNKVDSISNNVLDYSVTYDTTGRFNTYRVMTQLNPTASVHSIDSSNESTVSQNASVKDPAVRAGRQFVALSEESGSKADQKDRAIWEANIRKTRSRVYGASVSGFKNQTGNLWEINQVVHVEDDFANINSRMLINSVQFSIDDFNGRKTTLSLVEKDAYTLQISEPEVTSDSFGLGT